VSHATIPYWKKEEIRNALKALKKKLDDKDRAAKAAVANLVVDQIKEFVKANPNLPILVKELKAFSNTKALDTALKQVRSLSPETSALFVTVDPDSNKMFCLASVPKDAVGKGLKANEWVQVVAAKLGGKGGGKADSAQASGSNCAHVDDILDLAKKFAESKL
jgi:alanyl-tRNA synthetase